ncbi:MAG: tetratricopeptide repeat protein [Elusimicrobia bacterium]|nr:tetratricopeptide repeat protein [Elusimicrobiota bacterium]
MTLLVCAFLSLAPAWAVEPKDSSSQAEEQKIDLTSILIDVRVPENLHILYSRILGNALVELRDLPDKKQIRARLREITARELANLDEEEQFSNLAEEDKARFRKDFEVMFGSALNILADKIPPADPKKNEPVVVPPEPVVPNTPGTEVPPTPTDIKKSINEDLTTRYPERREGWQSTADLAMREKDFRTAQNSYKKIISLGGGTPQTYTGYGSASYHLGRLDMAADAARQALEIQPDYAPAAALRDLAERRVQGKGPSKALLASVAAFADGGGKVAAGAMPQGQGPGTVSGAGPSAPSAVPQPGLYGPGIQASDIRQADELVSQAANSLSLGDFPQAGAVATRAVGADPLNAQAWTLRAVADSNIGKHDNAVYNASMALLLVPGNTTALQMRSWSFNKTGKYREALRDADFTLAREPGNPFHHYNRAFAQAGLADRPGATASLKNAADLDARFAPPYKAAVSAPQDSDLLFVFDLMGPGTGAAAPPPPPKRFPRGLLYGLAAAGSLLGAAAVVYGLRRAMSSRGNPGSA